MPEFTALAKIRYSYDHDSSDTRKYSECLIIEADSLGEAEALIRMHYQELNHQSQSHNYQIRSLEVTQRLSADEIRRRHKKTMDYWDANYADDYGGWGSSGTPEGRKEDEA